MPRRTGGRLRALNRRNHDNAMNPDISMNAARGVLGLKPYEPGMPIEELQRKLGVANAVKLASNENPLGASPKVRQALVAAADSDLARYPDGSGFRLKQRLAALHGVDPSWITLGNGSNDILEFVARVWLGPGRAAMFSDHAFAVYPIVTQAQSAAAVIVPALGAETAMPFGHDLDGFRRALRDDIAVIFVANPNNPTGTWLSPDALSDFIAAVPASTIVVLDEAYWDYMDPELRVDSEALLRAHPNLVVTRTFSKAYGLASLRIGYGLSHPEVADLLNRVRQPFNNNALALLAAEAALDDPDFVAETVRLCKAEIARLTPELERRSLRVLPSQANFITEDFGRDAAPIHQGLLERGVIVRPTASYRMPTCLRVSLGTVAENDRFLAALDEVLASS